MTDLRTGIAIITGAGSGLGRALSLQLCRRGLHVAGLGRREEALKQTQLAATTGMFHPYPVDISNSEAVRDVISEISKAHGAITILINNAAVNPHRDFLDETEESFAETIAINLGGTVNVTRAVLDNMVQIGFGRILNVSSFAGDFPLPANSAYSVSKGAQRIFSHALTTDLVDRFPDIIVNTWMPGILATNMGTPSGISPDDAATWGTELALCNDRSLMGTTFERGREILPTRSLRRKLTDSLLLRRPKPRQF